jgi:hypothetical protein
MLSAEMVTYLTAIQEVAASSEEMFYSENDLLTMYEDLLATPEPPNDPKVEAERLKIQEADEDVKLIPAINKRLEAFTKFLAEPRKDASLASRLLKSDFSSVPADSQPLPTQQITSEAPLHTQVLSHLEKMATRYENIASEIPSATVQTMLPHFPITILNSREWVAIVRNSVSQASFLPHTCSLFIEPACSQRCRSGRNDS